MDLAIQLVLGTVISVFFIFMARRSGVRREMRIYAVGLVVVAMIYVCLAISGASLTWIGIELAGLVLFTLAALLGLRASVLFLAIGWTAHGAWDALLHTISVAGFVPDWYPVACLGFDLVLAGYIVLSKERLSGSHSI